MSGLTLKLEDDFYFDNAVIFGLVSEFPSYRLCYFINEYFKMKLRRSEKDKVTLYKGREVRYAQYCWDDKEQEVFWQLTVNKTSLEANKESAQLFTDGVSSTIPLIPSLKRLDYFLHYEGEASQKLENNISRGLKDMKQIRTFEKVDPFSTSKIFNLLIN